MGRPPLALPQKHKTLGNCREHDVRKGKGKTASEFMAELANDPAYQERLAQDRARALEKEAAVEKDEAGLVHDLARAGVQVSSVWDFVGRTVTSEAAVPILFEHLQAAHIPAVREGILRAFAYSHLARSSLPGLLAVFRDTSDPHERWLAANAIGTMASLSDVAGTPGIEEFAALFRKRDT